MNSTVCGLCESTFQAVDVDDVEYHDLLG